jgi:molybdopterin/thiamine biosynthesis adenylyltransferase
VTIEAYPERIRYERAIPWVRSSDIVIDARYDFPERYELNRACCSVGKPMVEAAMYGFEISLTTIVPGETPCLACMYPESDSAWEPLGFPVLGAVSGIAGCMAAMEAIKWITGIGEGAVGMMHRIDTLAFRQYSVSLKGIPLCPDCQKKSY